MSKKQESLKIEIYNLLKSRGLQPLSLESSGKTVPVPDEAEVFQFDFIKDGENYGKVFVTLDGLHQLIIYYNDEVASSPKAGSTDSESWENLLRILKRFATQRQLSFELSDQDNLENDMAKREHLKKQEQVTESYYAQGRKASYSDNVPTVTMRIQHSKVMEEGEQRFRHIEKIFVENQLGERFLLPTNKPGLGRVYARHIAEGGKSGDDRWNHITSLCEEYNKMAGFVRATRNGQFNESAQRLVTEGINHYQKLRESLSKLTGKRGYNAYFESYTPALMEDEEQVDLSEMFMSSSLDPRIENVMPILSKLSKNLGETKELAEVVSLEEWADSIIEGTDDDYVDPEEADYGEEYQNMVKSAGEFVKGVDQRKLDTIKRMHDIISGKNKEQGVAEGYQLDEGAVETITALVKKIPGIGKYYQMAQQYKPQLIEILKTSKSGKEVKQKMEQLAAGQSATVAESGMMKQLGGLAVGGGSILSTMWMNAMGMIDGVLAHAAAGEVGGAVASGSILGLIPVTLMLFAAMLLFKGSKQSSDEKAQAFQAQRGQQGMAEDLDPEQKSAGQFSVKDKFAKPGTLVGANESKEGQTDLDTIKRLVSR